MRYLSYCGIYCDECPIYVASMNDDTATRERLAKEYSNEHTTFETEDIYCEGCFWPKNDDSKMCGDCKVRACAKNKNGANCGMCMQYPCDTVDQYIPAGSDIRSRLDDIFNKSK